MIRRRILTGAAAVVTAALITGTYFAYDAHATARHQYTQTRATVAEALDELRETIAPADQIVEAEELLALAEVPGALAYMPPRVELRDDLADAVAAAEAVTSAEKLLTETAAASRWAILPSRINPLTEQLTSEARTVRNAPAATDLSAAIAAVQEELERTEWIVAMEQEIAAYDSQTVGGSYQTAALALAAIASQQIVVDRGDSACGTPPDGAAAAFVCGNEYGTIYLIPDVLDWRDPYAESALRHELAHQMIFQRCGDYDPLGIGPRFEAVTHSYAALFLGADRAELDRADDPHGRYAIDDESDAAARQIHDQGCVL